jgi:hypothetical protein
MESGSGGDAAVGKRQCPRVTLGPSSAATVMPPKPPEVEETLEPEYARLQYTNVDVWDGKRFMTQRALVDGGSQGNCIQEELSKDAPATHKLKSSPTTMIMADGNHSSAGPIIHFDARTVRIAGHIEQLALDIAPLSHLLILGMPWLRKHNPHIDYHSDTMTFNSAFCRQNCEHWGRTITLYPTDKIEPELEL